MGFTVWSCNSEIPGGESPKEMYTRIAGFLDELKTTHPNENILVVSHGYIKRCFDWYKNGKMQTEGAVDKVGNCEITEFIIPEKAIVRPSVL